MVQTCLDISSNNSVVSLLDVLECIIFVIAHLAVISKGLKDPLLRGEVKGSHDVNIPHLLILNLKVSLLYYNPVP